MDDKQCRKCLGTFPLTDEYWISKRRICRKCINGEHREYNKRRKEYLREYHKKYREQRLEAQRKRYNKETDKIRKKRNWSSDLEHARQRYHNNIEKEHNRSRQYRLNNPERARLWDLKHKYNIDGEWYAAKLEKQNGGCAICGQSPSSGRRHLSVDHDHETKALRGLLCENCNRGLGCFKDDIKIMRLALEYISFYKAENDY